MAQVYQTGFTLLFTIETCCKYGLEKKIHKNLKKFRINHFAGKELFDIDDVLIECIAGIKSFKGKVVGLNLPIDARLN